MKGSDAMLKGIPSTFSPSLLKMLMEMGHGEEIFISDANFPAVSNAQKIIRCDGLEIPLLLRDIIKFSPLDTVIEKTVCLAKIPDGEKIPDIWEIYREIIKKEYDNFKNFNYLTKENLINKAKTSCAVIVTGEKSLYANIILRKGLIF